MKFSFFVPRAAVANGYIPSRYRTFLPSQEVLLACAASDHWGHTAGSIWLYAHPSVLCHLPGPPQLSSNIFQGPCGRRGTVFHRDLPHP